MNTDKQSLLDASCALFQQFQASDWSDRSYDPEIKRRDDLLTVPLFGRSYQLSASGITDLSGDEATPAVCVLLLSYILNWPYPHPAEGAWITYREMDKGSPLAGYFTENKNKILETSFSRRLDTLRNAGLCNGGTIVDGHPGYDLTMRFQALPGVHLLLTFNDADDDFPAQSNLLFKESAKNYLGRKPLGIAGTLLIGNLLSTRSDPE